MSKDIYRALLSEFSQRIGLAGRFDDIDEPCSLVFKDVALTLFLDEAGGGLVNVFVDFGDFPRERALAIFERLLEINLLVCAQGSPRLGLDAETGRVIFTYAYPVQGLTAQKLLGSLDMAVQQAAVWRQGFYLDAPRVNAPELRDALMV
ncbi:MAG TPA: CesT family type III secretion system chaperone [Ramlibacter sp.]|uniref:CesT family type III secretion system chaperone n=1 Tax=Ramlibacter sp. TaxID=1917967 RepID=UPI002C89A528|nr:CesT family type III secretion system chaperone [Ramlibacter sp.]HVZ45989.1 CesT family type III secretion system chaperone [Ramlibacter sp.]